MTCAFFCLRFLTENLGVRDSADDVGVLAELSSSCWIVPLVYFLAYLVKAFFLDLNQFL